MAKVKIQGHASGTGILTVTAPNTSTDRTITLPDSTDTLIGAATTDALTTRINATGGRKNMIINGAMQVSQRATSATGKTSSGYYVTDRFKFSGSDCGTWTIAQEALSSGAAKEAGFSSATRLDCTTADASVAADSYLFLGTKLEGFDLQSLAKGTSGANAFTISFWVKSSTTGTYVLSVRDANSRHCGGTYTISVADTWEKKSITIPADTSGAITNHAGAGLNLDFWLAAGTDYSTGTMPTAWEALAATDRGAGLTHQMSSSTSKDWAITGVQLELGSTATDFEHRSYGEELSLCRRYFFKIWGKADESTCIGLGFNQNTTLTNLYLNFPVEMRTLVTVQQSGVQVMTGAATEAVTLEGIYDKSTFGQRVRFEAASGTPFVSDESLLIRMAAGASYYIQADAEL